MRFPLVGIISLAALLIFALAAVIEIREELRARDAHIGSVTDYVKSQASEAERLRRLGLNTFVPESHVTFGECLLRDIREDSQPLLGGLLRATFDLCLLLPLGLLASYMVAAAIRHPIRTRLGRLLIRLGLPVLGLGVVLFLIWLLLAIAIYSALGVPAG